MQLTDFVRDVPRSHVLTAGGIMNAPVDGQATTGTVGLTASVSELLVCPLIGLLFLNH